MIYLQSVFTLAFLMSFELLSDFRNLVFVFDKDMPYYFLDRVVLVVKTSFNWIQLDQEYSVDPKHWFDHEETELNDIEHSFPDKKGTYP